VNDFKIDAECPFPVPELVLVLPVYNEQASIKKVVLEWWDEVENWTDDFVLLAINDGSTDGTLQILRKLQQRLGSRLCVHDRANRGHGQSCLEGYRIAAHWGAEYVIQIDSDGQCDAQYFFKFWRQRKDHDVVMGIRTRRDDGLFRLLVSMVLRVMLLVRFRTFCPDANVPYRLMRVTFIVAAVERIPRDFYLANVALAFLLRRDRRCRHAYVPIRFRERYGGEPAVKAVKFGVRALELLRELRHLT
jgi:dolichol-phosphate mannosyltransferase